MEKKFEEALDELNEIVKKLESGNIDLDIAIDEYSKGMKLAKLCSDKITNAKEQVNKIHTEDGLVDFKVE